MIALNKKHTILSLALVGGLLLSQRALPIGRIGNNGLIGDPVEGFVANIPSAFPDVLSISADRSAKLISNEVIDANSENSISVGSNDLGDNQLSMLIYPLSAQFPELLGKSAEEITSYLSSTYQFAVTRVSAPNCATILLAENSVGYLGIAQWGGGHGYAVSVQKTITQTGREGILELLESTKILNPCLP